jgi:hypothetical protein
MQGKNQLARTGADYVKLVDSKADWIARSKEDFTVLRQSGKGPLSKLAEADYAAFVGSLKFEGGGVAHCTYKPLMSALTLTEIFQVFGYMGMDPAYVIETSDHASRTIARKYLMACAARSAFRNNLQGGPASA